MAQHKNIDVVFDVYRKSTLKGEARMKSQGIRMRVTGTSKTPTNWRSFLRDDDNKTEFQFLADRICQTQTTSTILVTKEGCVICNDNQKSLEAVSPCLHEEADIRILNYVHARDAAMEGNKALVINVNDTDIVVIEVSVLLQLQELGVETLWTASGNGVGMKWIPIHELLNAIGPARASGIVYFHAFTGCDVVSAFR